MTSQAFVPDYLAHRARSLPVLLGDGFSAFPLEEEPLSDPRQALIAAEVKGPDGRSYGVVHHKITSLVPFDNAGDLRRLRDCMNRGIHSLALGVVAEARSGCRPGRAPGAPRAVTG